MILYTIVDINDIFYEKNDKKMPETVCITNPSEYIRKDEYSIICSELREESQWISHKQ